MVIAFWILIALILMVFPGYPLFLWLASRLVRRPVDKADIQPSVSFIIAAYNEELVIRQKLENALAIDYPAELFEIIVASDCSSDNTDSITEEFADQGVILNRLEERGGKTANQNSAINRSRGDILVFSDASALYEPDAIKKLVRNFNDPEIGCSAGRLVHFAERTRQLVNEKNQYTSFEQRLKTMESSIFSIIGVNGPIYAIRRELARPLPEDLTSDFITPLDVILQGFRTVYEPEAISYEEVPRTHATEFRRKIRTVRAGVTVMAAMVALLNPFKYFWPCVFLIGHKILRWLLVWNLAALFVVNCFLIGVSPWYQVSLALQAMFYLAAALGELLKGRGAPRILSLPYFFCIYLLASSYGMIQFLTTERSEVWEVER